MKISKEHLSQVSYIKIDKFDDRIIPLQPCYLGNSEWELWQPTDEGMIRLQMVDVSDACYFGAEPARQTDIYLDFVNTIIKQFYFKEIMHFERGIVEDINNLSTSVSKINLFHSIWRQDKTKISRRFVTTEIEYVFSVCRSLFDLLQEVISKAWCRFQYSDESKKKKNLKQAFSKMVLADNKLLTAEEISERFLLPQELGDFYHRNGLFFCWLRSYRDKIIHSGHNIQPVFITDEGFAISTDLEPFDGLHIWNITKLQNNRLGSVRALLAYAILNTIHAFEDFSSLLKAIMLLPPDVAPNHKVFIRGENAQVLKELESYLNGAEWVKI